MIKVQLGGPLAPSRHQQAAHGGVVLRFEEGHHQLAPFTAVPGLLQGRLPFFRGGWLRGGWLQGGQIQGGRI